MPDQVEVPAVWVGLEELITQSANMFVCQLGGPGEIVLNIGHVAPPLLTGSPEEQAAQAQALRFVQVRGLGKYQMSYHRAEQLHKALGDILTAHRNSFGGGA